SCGHRSRGLRKAVSLPVSRMDLRQRWRAQRNGGVRGRLQFRSREKRTRAGQGGLLGEFCFRQSGRTRHPAPGIPRKGSGAGRAAEVEEKTEILRPPRLYAAL